jgi:hypothetical protein
MKCKPDYEFIVVSSGHIEIRTKTGEFVSSVCCEECLLELKKTIKKFERWLKKHPQEG